MKYCKACGSPLDDDGICTKDGCKRRELQLAEQSAKTDAEREKSVSLYARNNDRAMMKAAFLRAKKKKAEVLGVPADWL